MKSVNKILVALFAVIALSCCTKSDKDVQELAVYYYGAYNVHPGETITLTPSYYGGKPESFRIYSITLNGNLYYNPKLDGELDANSTFSIDALSGEFKLQKTDKLAVGTYLVSLSCKSGGKSYEFDDAISVKIVKSN